MADAPGGSPFGALRPRLPPPLVLRPFAEADVPRAYELEVAAFPPAEVAPLERLAYRAKFAPAYFHGLYDGDELIGLVVGTCVVGVDVKLDDGAMAKHDESGDGPLTLCVHSVIVEESRRRRGVGRAMMCEYVERIAQAPGPTQRVARVLLIAKADKISFYRSCGFTLLGASDIVHGTDKWFEMEVHTMAVRAAQG